MGLTQPSVVLDGHYQVIESPHNAVRRPERIRLIPLDQGTDAARRLLGASNDASSAADGAFEGIIAGLPAIELLLLLLAVAVRVVYLVVLLGRPRRGHQGGDAIKIKNVAIEVGHGWSWASVAVACRDATFSYDSGEFSEVSGFPKSMLMLVRSWMCGFEVGRVINCVFLLDYVSFVFKYEVVKSPLTSGALETTAVPRIDAPWLGLV